MNSLISNFVHDALSRGVSREAIIQALQNGGWDDKEINAALDAFVESELPVPVPRKRVSSSPKEAFLFLMLFAALYTTAFALGSVLFDLINTAMPLSNEPAQRLIISLRYGLASVVVGFPIFLFMCRIVTREALKNPGQRISPVRRWLTYMTLFIASVSIVADLITLIIRFLEGDITLRFCLKVAVVAILAGGVFVYYLRDLRRDEVEPSSKSGMTRGMKLATAALISAVSAVIIAGFWVAGSPMRARLLTQDEQRVRDLGAIFQRVEQYYWNKGNLPESLDACDINPATSIAQKTDRVTGVPYVYRVQDQTHFQLGATFAMPSESGKSGVNYLWPTDEGFWEHEAGLHIFTIDAAQDPSRRLLLQQRSD
jgi:hypothetical protein